MSARDQQSKERERDVGSSQERCQGVGLLKRETQTSVIDVVCKGRTYHVVYTDQGFARGCCKGLCCVRTHAQAAGHTLAGFSPLGKGLIRDLRTRTPRVCDPVNTVQRHACILECLPHCSWLPGQGSRGNLKARYLALNTCHMSLMSPNGVHRVYPPKLFMTAVQGKRNVSNVV